MIRTGTALCALAAAALLTGCGGVQVRSTARVTKTTHTVSKLVPTSAQASSSPASPSSTTAAVTPIAPVELYQPLAQYRIYVDRLLAKLRAQLRTLRTATASHDPVAAKADWIAAHASWLEIGQDDDAYGAFAELGQQIDGPAAGLKGTSSNRGFTGFHKVELDLWRDHDMAAAAADTAKLVSLVGQLTPKAVSSDLPTSALALDGWVLRCHEIMEDALRDSLSQNDDYGSNSDLASLASDVSATREVLALLAPLIEPRVPSIVPQGSTDLSAIDNAIQAAGGPTAGRSLAALPARKRLALDQAAGAALEVLAPVSELMQVTVPGS